MARYDTIDVCMKVLEVLEKDLQLKPKQVSAQERSKVINIIQKLEGSLVFQDIEMEVAMSGDTINISDVKNSIINVKSTLDQVEQALGSIPFAADKTDDLKKLVQELRDALASLPPDKHSDAEALSDAVKDTMDKAAKPQPNKKSIEISAKGILDAAKDIAEVVPIATKIASTIAGVFGFAL